MAKRNFQEGKNAGKVAEVIRNSNMSGNAATAVDLDINKIDENPDNEMIFDMSGIEQLAKEIEEFGFAGAIDVYQKDDGRYELSSGHRRYRAVKSLGRTTIPAIIKPMPSDTVRRHMLIHSNTMNRVLSYSDMARAIKYERETFIMEMAKEKGVEPYRDKDGELQADIDMTAVANKVSETFNISLTQIYRYLAVLKVKNDEIVSLLDQKRIPLKPIITIAGCTEDSKIKIAKAFKSELSMWGGDKDAPSVLTQAQCENIIKTVLRANKEGINDDSGLAYSGTVKYEKPVPLDFDTLDGNAIFDPPEMEVQQAPSHFENFENEQEDITEKEESVESYPEVSKPSDLVVQEQTEDMAGDNGESDYLQEPEEPEKAAEMKPEPVYRNYIDNTIIMFTSQMSLFVKNEYDIQDKVKLSENIEMLEGILNQIKEKL